MHHDTMLLLSYFLKLFVLAIYIIKTEDGPEYRHEKIPVGHVACMYIDISKINPLIILTNRNSYWTSKIYCILAGW